MNMPLAGPGAVREMGEEHPEGRTAAEVVTGAGPFLNRGLGLALLCLPAWLVASQQVHRYRKTANGGCLDVNEYEHGS